MPSIAAASSPSPYRIRMTLTAAGSTTASDYTLTREDGAPTAITCTVAWQTGPSTAVEIALSDPMIDGVTYLVALSGFGSAVVSYRTPLVVGAFQADDPEIDIFGIDIDWLASDLGADGDAPQARGLDSFRRDKGVEAVLVPGDLVHRPDRGAGIPLRVNGPGSDDELRRMASALKQQYGLDELVEPGGVSVTASADGSGFVTLTASIKTIALEQPVAVRAR